MNIITKKHLSRRAFVRGSGASIALPLLGAMIPAMTAQAKTVANAPLRFGVVYTGNGAAMQHFVPSTTGANYKMSRSLEPLEPFRAKVLVLTGMDNEPAAAVPGDPAGAHGRCAPAFLTGVHPKPTVSSDYSTGAMSIDQAIAMKIGQRTRLPSLELAVEDSFSGQCDAGYNCVYLNSLAWSSPKTPLPVENNPRTVFEMLFGDGKATTKEAQLQRLHERKSILDSVKGDIGRLKRDLGASDVAQVDEYLSSLREVERRIERAEQNTADVPVVVRPAGIPTDRTEHAKLMYDLMAMAYQADITRVSTLLASRELSSRTYPEIGVPSPHHAISHHRDLAENLEAQAKIDKYHTELFAYFLGKLQATPDGDGTLLDHVVLLKGASMGNSNVHDPRDLPIVLAGGGSGRIKPGQHLRNVGTPLCNLHVSLLKTFDVPVNSWGNSTGALTV